MRRFALVFLFIPLFSCNIQDQTPDLPDKPNIIFISADDLGYGDLSCYGGKDILTPELDKLAASGIRLSNYYVNCPVCSPSRASWLTGKYPDKAGVPGVVRPIESINFGYLDPNTTLLPALLKEEGYQTALIGKWHLGLESPNLPNERGFDYSKSWLSGMTDYYTHIQHGQNFLRENNKEFKEEGHLTGLITKWAIEYLDNYKGSDGPLYLYLAYTAPHDPIQPPEEWLEKVRGRESGMNEKRAKIVALIEHLDFNIGQVLEKVKSKLDMSNTMVVFTSDNGGNLRFNASNGELRGGKQDMYEGGIKVPCFVYWPGNVVDANVSDELIVGMDWFTTICNYAGVSDIPEVDGIDISPVFNKGGHLPARTLFWVRREGWKYGGMAYYAARYRNYKLVYNSPFEPMQFFDLEQDPKEQYPLKEGDNPEFKKLKSALVKHIQEAGEVPWQKRGD